MKLFDVESIHFRISLKHTEDMLNLAPSDRLAVEFNISKTASNIWLAITFNLTQ